MTQPKGTIVVIGGAEDREGNNDPEIEEQNRDSRKYDILNHLTPLPKNETRISIITAASGKPEELGEIYKKTFNEIGIHKIDLIHYRNREETRDENKLELIGNGNLVFFTGGDQFKLVTIIGGTPVAEAINRKYMEDKSFVVAGTSAGAAAMPKVMIYEGIKSEAMLKGDVKTMSGMGFFDGCIIDTHFIKRGRFSRLAQAVITNPSCVGIGIGEDTALIIKKGNRMECFGSGMVVVIDGKNIGFTNIIAAEENMPICVGNLTVHLMCKGNIYMLSERKFIPGSVEDV